LKSGTSIYIFCPGCKFTLVVNTPIGVIPIHLFDDDVHIRIGRDQRMKLAVGRNGVACLGPQVGETNASS
jgi:hypothetical protein